MNTKFDRLASESNRNIDHCEVFALDGRLLGSLPSASFSDGHIARGGQFLIISVRAGLKAKTLKLTLHP